MKRFTDRYINQITGLFVLLALLILGAGVYSAGRAHRWFQSTIDMSLLLPEEGCFGLKPGAGVTILGAKAGEVTDIEIRPDSRMVARLVVREDFANFVGTESRVTIKKTLGMAGDAFVQISGQPGRSLTTDTLIATTMDRDMSEMLQETMDQIRTEVLPAIRAIRSAADRHVQLTNGLEQPALEVLDTLNSVTTKIDKGDGLANKLLADKTMAGDVSEVIQQAGTMMEETGAAARELRILAAEMGKSTQKLNETIEGFPETVHQVNTALEDIRKVSENLIRVTALMPSTIENVNDQLKLLSGVMIQTQTSLREIQRLTEAAQRHWLIRDYVEDDEPSVRISPKDVIVSP